MTTQAEQFSALFHDDGQCFETDDGRPFDEVADAMGASLTYSERLFDDDGDSYYYADGYRADHISGDPIRYAFPDGSAIILAGDAWDFEGETPFSWRG